MKSETLLVPSICDKSHLACVTVFIHLSTYCSQEANGMFPCSGTKLFLVNRPCWPWGNSHFSCTGLLTALDCVRQPLVSGLCPWTFCFLWEAPPQIHVTHSSSLQILAQTLLLNEVPQASCSTRRPALASFLHQPLYFFRSL
jgi:hypothetical protein